MFLTEIEAYDIEIVASRVKVRGLVYCKGKKVERLPLPGNGDSIS